MDETISLKEIYEVIKKRIRLILSLTVGAILIAAVVSYAILTPTYESSSQFIVNQSQQDKMETYDVNDIRSNVELINTYNVIIKSTAILNDVVDQLNLDISATTLAKDIQVSSEQDSQVVTVTVTDESPEQATDIANATVDIFQDKIADIMNVDNVSVLTEASTPGNPKPVAPNPKLNIAIALVLGAMIGIGVAFLLEYLDNTIATEEDLEKHLDLPILGVISHIENDHIEDGKEKFKINQGNRGDLHAMARKRQE